MLTISEIKNASIGDLQKELAEARMKHHSSNMAVRTQQSKSTHEPKLLKRYIARLLQQIGILSKTATPTVEPTATPEVAEENSKS